MFSVRVWSLGFLARLSHQKKKERKKETCYIGLKYCLP